MGIPLISTLERQNGANFPLVKAEDAIGAFIVVADVAARDVIPTNCLRAGQVVRIGTSSTYYQWSGSVWASYTFGGGGSGDVVGPASSVAARIATYADTTGKNLSDGGQTIAQVIAAAAAAAPQGDVNRDGSVPYTGNQSMGGNKLTSLGNGTLGSQDAAPVAQVEALIAAAVSSVADWKQSARAATTAALPTNTRSGNVLTASANGALAAQDGVTLVLNDRLLVKDEATGANRGIYTVTAVGSGGAPWQLTRATDCDTDAEVTAGLTVVVEAGTVNGPGGTGGGNVFILTTSGTITVNTTALTFARLGTAQADGTTILLNGGQLQRAGLTGDVTAPAGSNATTIANGVVTVAKMAAIAALTVLANATNASASPTALAFAADGDVLMRSGTALASGKIANANVATNAAIAGSKIAPDFTANVSVTQPVATSGSPKALTVTGGAHTTLAASTQAPDVDFALARTVQFATGALASQRAVRITAPTYGFVGASTITNAATVAISGAPAAGTNATLTNSYALWIESGNIKVGTDTAVAAATAVDTTVYVANATGTGATKGASLLVQVGSGAEEGTFGVLAPNGTSILGVGRSTAQYVMTIGGSSSTTSIVNFINTPANALPCVVQIQTTSNNDGRTLLVAGQAAQVNGGEVIIAGGRGLTGAHGSVTIRLGSYVNGIISGGTAHTMFQAVHLASGARRITALNYPGSGGAGVTTTEMPANTGDLVTFVGDAASVPSADAGSGYIQYSDGAKPGWRFNGTNLRFNGTAASATAGGAGSLPATIAGYLDVQVNGTQRKIPYYAA